MTLLKSLQALQAQRKLNRYFFSAKFLARSHLGFSPSVHPGLERSAETRGTYHSYQRAALYSGHVPCLQGLVEEDWKEVLVKELLDKLQLFVLPMQIVERS